MKRMVELPTGVWIDVDAIESIEPCHTSSSLIRMTSKTFYQVEDMEPIDVIQHIQFAWRSWREGGA